MNEKGKEPRQAIKKAPNADEWDAALNAVTDSASSLHLKFKTREPGKTIVRAETAPATQKLDSGSSDTGASFASLVVRSSTANNADKLNSQHSGLHRTKASRDLKPKNILQEQNSTNEKLRQ
jgi:hypothetical protein